jgi:hypothetical protein
MSAEAEHGERDQWCRGVEAERDSGDQPDLGVGGFVERVRSHRRLHAVATIRVMLLGCG